MQKITRLKIAKLSTSIKYKVFGSFYLMFLLAVLGILSEQFNLFWSWWRIFIYGFSLLAFIFLMVNDPKDEPEEIPEAIKAQTE